MSHQFGWSASEAGSSFFWRYALSQLPGGWLAKIFGGRNVLEIGVLTWSLATALVPIVAGFTPGLVLSRVLELEKVFPHLRRRTLLPGQYLWKSGQELLQLSLVV